MFFGCSFSLCGLYWTPAFLRGVLNLCISWERGTFKTSPSKNPGLWVSNELPWLAKRHTWCYSPLPGNYVHPGCLHWEKTLNVCTWFPQICPPHFSLFWFCFVSVHLVNPRCGFNFTLSPRHPPRKSSSLRPSLASILPRNCMFTLDKNIFGITCKRIKLYMLDRQCFPIHLPCKEIWCHLWQALPQVVPTQCF